MKKGARMSRGERWGQGGRGSEVEKAEQSYHSSNIENIVPETK